MKLDFQKDAEEFEINHDFLDNPENGGGKGNGQQRRINLIRMAMEFGAMKATTAIVQNIQKDGTGKEIRAHRIASNGHEDSRIFDKKK